MQVVILAGGIATRMRPLTDSIPKALIPIDSQPFAHHQLQWLASQGGNRVLYSIGYRGEMIREFVGDGSRWGLEVTYVDEGKDLRGTGGALRFAWEQGALESHFTLMYGDSYLPIDLREVWKFYESRKPPALMTVLHNSGQWDQSNVKYDRATQKVLLYDKKRSEDFDYIDYGLSILSRSLVEERIPPRVKFDLADLFHGLSKEGSLAGFEVNQRFFEIGSPTGLEDFRAWVRNRENL